MGKVFAKSMAAVAVACIALAPADVMGALIYDAMSIYGASDGTLVYDFDWDSEGHMIREFRVSAANNASGSVVVPSRVDVAFYSDYGFSSDPVPDWEDTIRVTSVQAEGFKNRTSISSVSLPSSITSIGDGAFSGCTSLRSVNIPSGVKRIGSLTFNRCVSLTQINIPSSVTDIAVDAFKGCSGMTYFNVSSANPAYASYDGALYTMDLRKLICYPGGRADVAPSPNLADTAEDAFTGCGKLWAEWFSAYRKTRYDLAHSGAEDRSIVSLTVDRDITLDKFDAKDGKVFDFAMYVRNTADQSVKLTLPKGYAYKAFKGASPLKLPAGSENIISVTRIAEGTFLVTREQLKTLQ